MPVGSAACRSSPGARCGCAGRCARRPRSICSASACVGVVDDVEHRLDQLLAVAAELGDRGVVVALDRPARAGYSASTSERMRSQHLVDVDVGRRPAALRCGASRRSTSACSRSASWMMTCVYSPSSALVDLQLQQLRRAADAAQRVLDLVGQVADQLLGDLRLAERALLAVLARLLLDLDHLDEHAPAVQVVLADDHVHRQRARAHDTDDALERAVEAARRELVARDRGDRLATARPSRGTSRRCCRA